VAAGAFGAHALAERLGERELALWETAARYLMYAGLGQLAAALAALQWPARALRLAPPALFLGGIIFSGTLFTMALGGPRWLGAITPLGGLGLIVGFVALAIGAWRGGQE
jgi:uncharacterized membrane protein YgdD (TMEM256/DUF423 family)